MRQGPILIVDDDPAVRTLLVEALEERGYAAVSVGNGADGIAAVDLIQPQLVLLDLSMPVVDGQSFAQELRRRRRDIPMLVLSASSDARTIATAIEAEDCLPKPFDVDDLLDRVSMLAVPPTPWPDGQAHAPA